VIDENKTPAHWLRKLKQINSLWHRNTSMLSRRETKKFLSNTREDYVSKINLCVKLVIPLIFTEIQRKGIRLLNESNCKLHV